MKGKERTKSKKAATRRWSSKGRLNTADSSHAQRQLQNIKLTANMPSYSEAMVLATWEAEHCPSAGAPAFRGNASWAHRCVHRGLKRSEPDPNWKWSKNWFKDA